MVTSANRWPRTLLLIAILIVSSVLTLASTTKTVQAFTNGVPPSNPANDWAPYGPFVHNLQFQVYGGTVAASFAIGGGQLDLVDAPVSPLGGPDITVSPAQTDYDMLVIDFNYLAATWANWGCAWQNGQSACGVEMREALAHLVDRQRLLPPGAGVALADPSPAAKNPAASPLATQCAWDSLPAHQNCIGAFNLAFDGGGFAAIGSPDFCAAVDHLIQATVDAPALGLQRDPNAPLDAFGNHCGISPNSPGLPIMTAFPIRFSFSPTDPTIARLGVGLTTAIDNLFGPAVVNDIGAPPGVPFLAPPLAPPNLWDMVITQWTLKGPFVDHILGFYGSQSTNGVCGGVQTGRPLNYASVCIPAFDADALAAMTTGDFNTYRTDTLAAFNQLGLHVANIPLFTRNGRFAALTDIGGLSGPPIAGLVNQVGLGYANFWTALNGMKSPTYIPGNPLYTFGGTDPTTMRWGQSQPTSTLNPFLADNLQEFNILGEVYDTLFQADPAADANVFCWTCDSSPAFIDAQGNEHFQVEMRQDLYWQDGVPVSSSDVKFSLLNTRDYAGQASRFAMEVLDVTLLSPIVLDIKMQGAGIVSLQDLAQVLIVPRHLWECPANGLSFITNTPCNPAKYGDVGQVDPDRLSPSFDPVSSGTFIGTGPFACRSLFKADLGKVGTGCAEIGGVRGGQNLAVGAALKLQAYDRTSDTGAVNPFLQYMRSYNPNWGFVPCADTKGNIVAYSLEPRTCPAGTTPVISFTADESGQFQEFSWADRFDNDTVTIQSLADVALCYGSTMSLLRFVDSNPNNGVWDPGETVVFDTNNNGMYDAGDVVVSGAAPAIGTTLAHDYRISFIDSNGNTVWDPTKEVVFDVNANRLYDRRDPLVKFVDNIANGHWDAGEPLVYDANNDNRFDAGDTIITGAPVNGALLSSDSLIKFVDNNGDNHWNVGEAIVYDANNDDTYNAGDTGIVNPPAFGTALWKEQIITPLGTPPRDGTLVFHSYPTCPIREWTYWWRPAIHPNKPNLFLVEILVVASHFDDSGTSPFSWNGLSWQQPTGFTIPNIVPFTYNCPPYNNPAPGIFQTSTPCFP